MTEQVYHKDRRYGANSTKVNTYEEKIDLPTSMGDLKWPNIQERHYDDKDGFEPIRVFSRYNYLSLEMYPEQFRKQIMFYKKNTMSLEINDKVWLSSLLVNLENIMKLNEDKIATLEEQVTTLQKSNHSLRNNILHQNETSINMLKDIGFGDIADLLTNLHQASMEEGIILIPSSLQNFVLFIVREPLFLIPEIGLNPDGCVQTVWQIPNYGSLAMDFLTSGNVAFSILHYPLDSKEQKNHSDVSPMSSIMHNIGEFADKLRNG